MRSILITIFTLFLMVTTVGGQAMWEIMDEGIGSSRCFDFINKDTGWVAGDDGIVKTMDGGESWFQIINEKLEFNKIDCITEENAWAVIDWDCVGWTMDGGLTWQKRRFQDYEIDIAPVNDSIAYAFGAQYRSGSGIFKTTDRGGFWQDITPSDYDGAGLQVGCFLNADTGFVVGVLPKEVRNGSNIFRTFDGGITWVKYEFPEFSSIRNLKIRNDSTLYFMAVRRYPDEEYSTDDVCEADYSLSNLTTLYSSEQRLHHCDYLDNGDIVITTLGGDILKSNDDGLSWYETDGNPPGPIIYQTKYIDEVGYIFGGGSRMGNFIMKSIDHGNSWENIKVTLPIFDVCFVNSNKGFLVCGDPMGHGSWGMVYMTEDAGLSWGEIFSTNNNIFLFRCHFLNESKGYLVGMPNGGISGSLISYGTTDGGLSWHEDNTMPIYDISSVKDSLIWALVNYPPQRLYQTSDTGATWNKIYSISSEQCFTDEYGNLISIFFNDSTSGFGVGNNGLIIKFSLPETIECISSETSLPLNKVFFSNRDRGWISGGYMNEDGFSPIFLRTEDGGESWREVEGLNYLINDFYFETDFRGWAVGEDADEKGVILETSDGGLSWEIAIDSLSGGLNALHMQEGTGWAVGDNRLILKSEYNSTTAIGRNDIAEAWNEDLLSNYPNPFQSKTTINYQLQSTTDVELNIYDLSGRKVASLMNESQPEGKHELEWNAGDMQPGVYICELKTNMGKQVIKMILTE